MMCAFVWVNGIFWGVTPLLGWSSISYEPTHLSCTVNLMNPSMAYTTYILASFVWFFFIPLCVLVYFQIRYQKDYETISEQNGQPRVRIYTYISIYIYIDKSIYK